MRISTNTIFDAGVAAITRQSALGSDIQQHIAAGKRVLKPSDDPIASARALQVEQAIATNEQYRVNRDSAQGLLGLVELGLGHAGNILQNVRERIIQAGVSALTELDLRAIAEDIRSLRSELLAVANSTDGEGQYLFAGYQNSVVPFVESAAGVQYRGDDGQRLIQVSASRQIAVSESGADTFARIRQGNGDTVVTANAANTGSGTYDLGSVRDPALLTGNDYRIDFTVTGTLPNTTTTYDVVNVTTATTLLAGQAYVDNGAIVFDGQEVVISGQPANGDSFSVVRSTSQDVFTTLDNLINVLRSTPDTPLGQIQRTNGLTSALGNVDQALDQFLSLRSGLGARLREVDDLQSIGQDLDLQGRETLSKLTDLDYAKAVSDLARQQGFLEAAQQSFIKITQLSLFNFL